MTEEPDFAAAAEYAERHGLHALVIERHGQTVFERYGEGWTCEKPHALFSGAKTFWGVVALRAVEDRLLTLDEPVGETLPTWKTELRARVTLRTLLNLTSGLPFGGLGRTVPLFERAAEVEPVDEPGTKFTYGGIPLQVFGAVLARKLQGSPHDYLRTRVLEPLDLKIASWRTLSDGMQPLPTGAFVAASQWLKFGRLLAADAALAPAFEGSRANPRYGLGIWLSPFATLPALAYASGAAGQALYVERASGLVVAKFGDSNSYRHETFLSRLFRLAKGRGATRQAAAAPRSG